MNQFSKKPIACLVACLAVLGFVTIAFWMDSGDKQSTVADLEMKSEGKIQVDDSIVSSEGSSPSHISENAGKSVGAEVRGSLREETVPSNARELATGQNPTVDSSASTLPILSQDSVSSSDKDTFTEEVEVVERRPACVVASFKSEQKILDKAQVLELPEDLKGKTYCISADSEPVSFSPRDLRGEKVAAVAMDWVPSKRTAEIEMVYCIDAKNCPLKCAEPEKDFWDELNVDDVTNTEEGFLGENTAQEEELSKELSQLKELLDQSSAKQDLAVWKVASQEPVECQTSVLGGR